jgi:hypothetical protein
MESTRASVNLINEENWQRTEKSGTNAVAVAVAVTVARAEPRQICLLDPASA